MCKVGVVKMTSIPGKRPAADANSTSKRSKKVTIDVGNEDSLLKKVNIGFIGGGNMARALVIGILSSDAAKGKF